MRNHFSQLKMDFLVQTLNFDPVEPEKRVGIYSANIMLV